MHWLCGRDDEGLLLVGVEKKVERCKAAELFIVGRESTGLKNQLLWDCFLYPLLYPDLTMCIRGDLRVIVVRVA